jgi:hypothetical protein
VLRSCRSFYQLILWWIMAVKRLNSVTIISFRVHYDSLLTNRLNYCRISSEHRFLVSSPPGLMIIFDCSNDHCSLIILSFDVVCELLVTQYRSHDSWVGIATDCTSGVRISSGARLYSTMSRPALRPTQPPFQWAPGPFSLGVKLQGCEPDHSHPSSAQVKNSGAVPPLPHTSLWSGA